MRPAAALGALLLIVLLTSILPAASAPAKPLTLQQARQAIASVREDLANLLWWGSEGPAHGSGAGYREVLSYCDMIAELDPHDIEAWGQGAYVAGLLGDQAGRTERYRRGIAANPQNHRLYFELGMTYVRKRDFRAAEPYLAKAAALPCPSLVVRSYAHCLDKLGKRSQALAQWQRVLKMSPGDPVAQREIGRLSAGKGK